MSVKLQTSDDKIYEVGREIAQRSNTVKNLLDDFPDNEDVTIPIPMVTSYILEKVLTYFEQECLSTMDQSELFEVILAANYLDIEDLLNDACQVVADMMKGLTTEQIRELFHIENDFTPEEEAEIKREHCWFEEDK